MHLSKMPLSESHHETLEQSSAPADEDVQTIRQNSRIFKQQVEKEIVELTAAHALEVKRLYNKIQEQARIIDIYEKRFGRIDSASPVRKENIEELPSSPNKTALQISANLSAAPYSRLQSSNIINRLSSESPIKQISKNSAELGMMFCDSSLDSPPDELYKSRF